MNTIDIVPLHIPEKIDDADATDFLSMIDVRNRIYREINGNDDEDLSPEAALPHYQPNPDETRRSWIVREGGRVIGRVGLDLPHEAGSVSAYWLIELLREAQGRGIGTRAHTLIEQAAREAGRTVLQSWAQHNAEPGEHLPSPTGYGSIPKNHEARFYLRHGYTLGQVERRSELDPAAAADTVDRLLADAREAASGYRVVQWMLPTPPERVDGYAWMKSRMSTDVPAGEMDVDEETWDAARVARHDSRYLDGGQTVQVTAAQHVATGELVAYNELSVAADRTRPTEQYDTLVLREHRGHRLGQLVKCAGLVSWREVAPDSPKVITYNAEENRPMLDINERIGFVPSAYIGAWKKVLD